jgi:uncharacterized membrane protein
VTDKGRYEEFKKRTRRDNTLFLAILTLFGAATLVEYWLGIGGMVFTITVMMFVALAAFAIIRMVMADRMLKNLPEYVPDERTKKIDEYARSRSWQVTFSLVCLLVGLVAFRIMDLGTHISLIIIFLVMGYSWIIFKWYYGRKGDVG